MTVKAINKAIADDARKRSIALRFWEKVRRSSTGECWPWIAKSRHRFGYGVLQLGRDLGTANAHCLAWALTNGEIPDGAYVLHRCDNPTCCNPRHLYIGDFQQNMNDMWARGRKKNCKHSPETIQKIKEGRAKNPPKITEAGRLSRSAALRKRWTDPEWRRRFNELMSGESNPMARRTRSQL